MVRKTVSQASFPLSRIRDNVRIRQSHFLPYIPCPSFISLIRLYTNLVIDSNELTPRSTVLLQKPKSLRQSRNTPRLYTHKPKYPLTCSYEPVTHILSSQFIYHNRIIESIFKDFGLLKLRICDKS
jgi:hypothetical protein